MERARIIRNPGFRGPGARRWLVINGGYPANRDNIRFSSHAAIVQPRPMKNPQTNQIKSAFIVIAGVMWKPPSVSDLVNSVERNTTAKRFLLRTSSIYSTSKNRK